MAISLGHRLTLGIGFPAIIASAVPLVIYTTVAVEGPDRGGKGRIIRWMLTGQYVVDDHALLWARIWFAIFVACMIVTVGAAIIISLRQEPWSRSTRGQ